MPDPVLPTRDRSFIPFADVPPETRGDRRHWLAQARNFTTEWVAFGAATSSFDVASEAELLVLAVQGPLLVQPAAGAVKPAEVPTDAFGVLPAGRYGVQGGAGAVALVIATDRIDLAGRSFTNADAYREPDARIVPTGRPWQRQQPRAQVEVLPITAIMASPQKPRLKMLQTETMSLNIVDYDGPRDRKALSPHSHDDFEQGSFAIHGNFMHHLRTPWTSNADLWRDDEHLPAPSPSLVVVPVGLVHTTEGVGEGRHLLLDIFSPPRADFIGNGWVFNAAEYRRSEAARAA